MKQISRELQTLLGFKIPSNAEQNAELAKSRLYVLEATKNLHNKKVQYLAEECYELYKNMNRKILSDDEMLTSSILAVTQNLEAVSSVTFSQESKDLYDSTVKSAIETTQILLVKLFSCPQLVEVTA